MSEFWAGFLVGLGAVIAVEALLGLAAYFFLRGMRITG